jgi:hypothetical protein
MACPLKNIKLDPVAAGETWGGLTFTIDASDDTAYAAALTRVRMSWRAAGAVALTLDSAVAGQITIATATAYGWSFTVEPRALALDPGFYTWAIEVTSAAGIDKDLLSGTQQIIPDPHA